ncbi:hypothetical protein FGG08_001977 [Glutinoglossum americanum]|uniref:Phosphoribosylaminoimidazole-succinocarboxamide synthase n=1 Tax=Glutinoglossum americanum TaxID=1670608 RepID=A0A9P8IA81_9PEZI|nr:hypothetical protein FGG08_001977 [Glutinoglossum americanum]
MASPDPPPPQTEQPPPPTTPTDLVTETDLTDILPLVARGKVRDIYQLDAQTLLFIATDRISAYDVVMKNGIPRKGTLLTLLSTHWFRLLAAAHPPLKTHFLTLALPPAVPRALRHRAMQVRRLAPLPVEVIVRGYVTGSAWREYCAAGTVHGVRVAPGLRECERFPGGPMFTPSTKAELGMHDENIHPDKVTSLLGPTLAARLTTLATSLYTTAHAHALAAGLILADTKFEFALSPPTPLPIADDPASSSPLPELVLIDEVLTPDSSRYWPADKYEPGRPQESFDKQFLRDWLSGGGMGGVEGGVEMPAWVVEGTRGRYEEVFERLTGRGLGDWIEELEGEK